MEINKTYNPNDIEDKWYQYWTKNGFFTPKKDPNKKPYTILIPPPNVTGILHMGHVLNNTIQDVMIRYKRMNGIPTLWIPGTDHAGIATQNMVEKELAKQGKSRYDVGREELIKMIWEWKEAKGGRILEQLKKLGASCDWSRLHFTMDEQLSKAVKEVFVKLYEDDLIYKGKYIINWCPRCHTALANDEVDHVDENGKLWHIRYPFANKEGYITIATTRPETMLGDVAVAVNPKDERYADLIGEELTLPLTSRIIPIIADDYVDLEFGSGCVKITPAHDPNDFEIGKRHNLENLVVIDDYGKMNENSGKDFAGLDRYEAREKIIKLLEEKGLLDHIENHNHAVGHCYRCNTVIEPYLSNQWFVKMKPMAEKAIQVVNNKEISFQPERWTKVYLHWMNNIRDWCISRQIWWGHRIPAYYCDDCGEMVVSKEQPEKCQKCGSKNFHQDEDVLDTWFSSWLWPFSTLGWPEKTEDLEYYLPTNMIVTAPGIIYLWVARMIMSTLKFTNKIPFDTVYLHGMVLDENGVKMSKSLGNSPDPIHIIEEFGADALRFGMIFNTPKGQDSYYSNSLIESGRNFANKIWNAFRFIMMNVEKIDGLPEKNSLKMELSDKWIYSRLNSTIESVRKSYDNLRLNDAAQGIMDFVWKDFCSWYLELSKERIYNNDDIEGQLTAKYVLLDILQQSMRLLHPLMPFISEEIWQTIRNYFPMPENALIIAKFPEFSESKVDLEIDHNMGTIQNIISAIRNLRKQVNISPAKNVDVLLNINSENEKLLLDEYSNYIKKLAKVENISAEINLVKPKGSIAAVASNIEVFLPLGDLIDIEQEKAKLNKQIVKLEKELNGIKRKLENEKFLKNAPEKILEKEKMKFNEVNDKLAKIKEIYNGL